MVDQASTIDSAARVSHATAEIDFTIGHLRRESSTFTTMESATPKKFKSNVLAALDVKPGIDDLENYNPLLTHTKRKQTPWLSGSSPAKKGRRWCPAEYSGVRERSLWVF
jgi:hypothetical protein